ncbi:hypothetical protein GCM10007291_06440 [Gemmobacter nanjingensis]|uniref:Secreted protein n=1 Tax=Gemmobacter nanjingensis TaxID=488454 RepID=A0ABQ3F7N4_9RHOB|nr:hypothetical protein [Gemmobacter nanjingensis]GHC12107.1 hypothetical protein GCM10007291_06440 [Gemmobacter nanjingensis]
MNLTPILLSGMAAGLSACVAAPAPQGASVKGGTYAVMQEGAEYQAQVSAGRAGKVLTRAGAQPVSGAMVRVAPFGMDQGKRAKDVAAMACTQAGGRFQPQAVGGYAAGAWEFEGGCA